MSTKKRFYIDAKEGIKYLRDTEGLRKYYVTWAATHDQHALQNLKELCDLLNKGWEAPEGETTTCCCGFCVRESQERTEEGR